MKSLLTCVLSACFLTLSASASANEPQKTVDEVLAEMDAATFDSQAELMATIESAIPENVPGFELSDDERATLRSFAPRDACTPYWTHVITSCGAGGVALANCVLRGGINCLGALFATSHCGNAIADAHTAGCVIDRALCGENRRFQCITGRFGIRTCQCF